MPQIHSLPVLCMPGTSQGCWSCFFCVLTSRGPVFFPSSCLYQHGGLSICAREPNKNEFFHHHHHHHSKQVSLPECCDRPGRQQVAPSPDSALASEEPRGLGSRHPLTCKLTLLHACDQPPPPSPCPLPLQTLHKNSARGECYVVDSEVITSGIPYQDYFYTVHRYCLTSINKHKSRLR